MIPTSLPVADWSMFQALFHGDPLTADEWDPAHYTVDIDFAAVKTQVSGVVIRLADGTLKDPCFDRFRAGLQAAHIPWGIYCAYHPARPLAAQLALVAQACPEPPELSAWGDFEIGQPTYAQTVAYLAGLDAIHHQAAGLYSNGPNINRYYSDAEQRALSERKLWIAGYPNFIKPRVGWQQGAAYTLHQYTEQGQLQGLPRPCDLSRRNVSMSAYPSHPQGSLNGIHAQQPGISEDMFKRARDGGYYIPWAFFIENPGMCVVAKRYDPRTVTGCRWLWPDGNWEYGQNIQTASDAELHAHISAILQWCIVHTNTEEWNAIDYIQCCHNEWDPPTEAGWRRFGVFCLWLMQTADALAPQLAAMGRKPYKLAFGALNCGTPEWNEMLAFADSGVFEYAAAHGHIRLYHEGAFEHQPVNWGFDGTPGPDGSPNPYTIPGAPYVPGSGNRSGRFKYWDVILDERHVFVPFAVSEVVLGGEYNLPVEDQLTRLAWQDTLYRRSGSCLGWGLFTIGAYDNWHGADYSYVQNAPGYDQYMRQTWPLRNGDDEMQALFHVTAQQDLAIRDLAGNPTTDPVGDPPAAPGLAGVVRKGTTLHVYQTGLTLPTGLANRIVINAATGANVWGIATAVQKT